MLLRLSGGVELVVGNWYFLMWSILRYRLDDEAWEN